jgi:hypothetical protein
LAHAAAAGGGSRHATIGQADSHGRRRIEALDGSEKAAVEANCLELDQEHVGDDTVVGLGEVDKQDERAEASALAAREHLE